MDRTIKDEVKDILETIKPKIKDYINYLMVEEFGLKTSNKEDNKLDDHYNKYEELESLKYF